MAGLTFTISYKKDLKKIQEKFDQASDKAKLALAIQMLKDTEPFVPARAKSLANRTQARKRVPLNTASKKASKAAIDAGDPVLIYPGPYAHYLYVGKLMVDPETNSPWASKGTTKVYAPKPLKISTAVHEKAQNRWFEASKAQNIEKWRRVAAKAITRYGR